MLVSSAMIYDVFVQSISLWWVIVPGMLLGIIVGILPGFSAQNTLIILLPLTLEMSIEAAMAFMISLYCTTQLGGGIPAILFNMPGEGGAAATTLDGYPMTKKGQAQQALVLCFAASAFGGLITTIGAMVLLPALGQLGFYFRSVEMVVVTVFGLTLIAAIAAKDMVRGLIAGALGLMIGAVGADPIFGTGRATFGMLELYDGVPMIPVLIGLFAISEAFVMIEHETIVDTADLSAAKSARWSDTLEGLVMTARYWWQTVWTSIIGLIIGILPGAGSTIAAFLAYHYSKACSKTPELYGTGHPPGVIAPESANNGVTSGTLVPVLALGIPGGTTGAIMMVVLTYQGVLLGPRLFIERPELVYSIYMQMLVCYCFMTLMILPLARYMSRVVWVPTRFLVPLILSMITIAAFSEREYIFDMGLALFFGVIGYIARKTQYEVTAILVGVIMGPLFEQYLLRSLRVAQGDLTVLFSSTLGNLLWLMVIATLVLPWLRNRRKEGVLARTVQAGYE
ncbi:tripartite tricarboxylate transporter permease [Microvirga massiliensis]|uniref:tripartite tricarboxylate transporter permease n=1 Tax=Microvirga massiliensis TaxID=1033741 RepID=UPI00062BC0E6|nr:tripartite tricarboxylate transporter permease [Microvirga massiliensis]